MKTILTMVCLFCVAGCASLRNPNAVARANVVKEMKKITIPKVEWHGTPLLAAISFLQESGGMTADGRPNIPFRLGLGPSETVEATLSWTAEDVTLHELFLTILRILDMNWHLQDGTVVLTFKNMRVRS